MNRARPLAALAALLVLGPPSALRASTGDGPAEAGAPGAVSGAAASSAAASDSRAPAHPGVAPDDAPARPTVQPRYGAKRRRPYLHVFGTLHLRNDFYRTLGVGGDAGFFLDETLGAELRVVLWRSDLNLAALRIREETGQVPDARPERLLLALGGRVSLGYGKVLLFDRWVLHFDPNLALHGGVTIADTRWLPTAAASASFLVHLPWGLQAKLDLGLTVQVEHRTRGWRTALGFMPVLGVGWKP